MSRINHEGVDEYLKNYQEETFNKKTAKKHKKETNRKQRVIEKKRIEEEYDRVEDIDEYIELYDDFESWEQEQDYDKVYYSSYNIPEDVTLVFTSDYYRVMDEVEVDVVYKDDI